MNEIENTLRSLLRNNIVSFTFRKVNGEIRHALGTRNLALASAHTDTRIPTPTGDMQPNSYYDVQSNGWRSWKTGCVISIDGVLPRTDTEFAKKPTLLNEPPKETKKPELPKREIPVSKPMEKGVANIDIDKILGGIFGGFGTPMGEIRKSMEDLGKDIVIGAPAHSPKVGTPTSTEKGIELPLGSVSVDDFAKLVAHYVVDELVARLTR